MPYLTVGEQAFNWAPIPYRNNVINNMSRYRKSVIVAPIPYRNNVIISKHYD